MGSSLQAVFCGGEAWKCILGEVERTLDPIYSPFPLSSLSPGFLKTLTTRGGGALLGVGKDADTSILSSLLLLLQVLGALFLAIGLWAWGEKVRWWSRVWGCRRLRWWQDQPDHWPLLPWHRAFSPTSRH